MTGFMTGAALRPVMTTRDEAFQPGAALIGGLATGAALICRA